MCTAATYRTEDHYFGRTLDYDFSYGEEVVITPRKHRLVFRNAPALDEHNAIIGMALVMDGTPLYFEGINEKGVGMAGLNFVNRHAMRLVIHKPIYPTSHSPEDIKTTMNEAYNVIMSALPEKYQGYVKNDDQ